MDRLVKILLVVLAGVVGIVVIAAVGLLLFFDPNDYRDEIAAEVEKATGRELTIAGDLSLSVFPWLAVEVGQTTLANAEGFGEQPFATFEHAELSMRLVPLILRQEITVGTAALDSLVLNLAVAEDGRTNWQDLAETAGEEPAEPATDGGPADLDIQNVLVRNAEIAYSDAQAGSSYKISGLTLETGRIAGGVPFDLDAEFDFAADPGEVAGHLAIAGTTTIGEELATLGIENLDVTGQIRGIAEEPAELAFTAPSVMVDMNRQTASIGELQFAFLGVQASASVEPFSYAGTPQPQARLQVEPFSLKGVMQALGTEPPVTADPAALTRVAFSAEAAVGETALALSSLTLELDDTTLKGTLSLPTTEDGLIEFDLAADSIDVDRYMAPGNVAADDAEAASTDDIEIPVDLIRALQARGSVTLDRATLAGMIFENIELGVNSADGKLRLHPIGAELFEGTYSGDVSIDASGETPSISVDEKVQGVNLAPLARAMFEQENISGLIAGSFKLTGRGADVAEIRSDLDGSMAFELADGAWEGTDIWHQLRAARALLRKQPPPEQSGPPRTEFTSVVATGTVTDGLFRNDDLLAELPFLQLTGQGNVDLVGGEVDYRLQARVLERPEFVGGASEAELEDFTEAVIPVRVSGPLTSPNVRPDVEGMVKAEVEEAVRQKRDEVKERLLNELFGGDDEDEAGEDQESSEEEEKLEDRLKSIFDQ
jgi:AsmA protein